MLSREKSQAQGRPGGWATNSLVLERSGGLEQSGLEEEKGREVGEIRRRGGLREHSQRGRSLKKRGFPKETREQQNHPLSQGSSLRQD